MEKFTLTKEEFIKRSMKGEVFIRDDVKYFYDSSYAVPFRVSRKKDNSNLAYCDWYAFNETNLFTLEQPTSIIERRWKWRFDHIQEAYTSETNGYMSDLYATTHRYIKDGWYKVEDLYIDVEVKEKSWI